MASTQVVVTIRRKGRYITARTNGATPQYSTIGTGRSDYPYEDLAGALRRRGLNATVNFGQGDHILHVELPDGSALVVSPSQELPGDHRPGYPPDWLVTRGNPADSSLHEVVYDSGPGGLHARFGGSVTELLAAVDSRLDQLGLARDPVIEPESVLHRAGFVPVVGEGFHRLPVAMTNPDEQRRAVTRAVGMLSAYSIVSVCDDDLLDACVPVRRDHPQPAGDRIAEITRALARAGHTREAVDALSELTAPGDGVLVRVLEALDETVTWWEGLGTPVDRLYGDRLRRVVDRMWVSALEVRALRGELADRHTAHPAHGNNSKGPPAPEEAQHHIRDAPASSPHHTPSPTTPAPRFPASAPARRHRR
ncbi:hypothetical protein [Streptomyces sp. SID1121]|uniref:hypothetical protein n=1 Tax=Streptomyces sp. SID1121 TaxID=3425888 RepID=UPI0040579114